VVANDAVSRFTVGLDSVFFGGCAADGVSAATGEEKAAAQDGAEQE
jgi:hypothetical protein